MIIIKPDYDCRIEIAGIPDPVRRPVAIDQSRTGFFNLRSLRIYRFDAHSVVEGHAEEDEVFMVVMAGSVDLAIRDAGSPLDGDAFTLSAPWKGGDVACAAYLQPGSAYRLTPRTDADVAYARATPADGPPSRVFCSQPTKSGTEWEILDEAGYARRLRIRLFHVHAMDVNVTFKPVDASEASHEALVHVRTAPSDWGCSILNGTDVEKLESWDTLAVAPGESPLLSVARRSQASALVVSAF